MTKWHDQFDGRNRRLPQNARSIGTKSVQMFQRELYISLIVYNSLAQLRRLTSFEKNCPISCERHGASRRYCGQSETGG